MLRGRGDSLVKGSRSLKKNSRRFSGWQLYYAIERLRRKNHLRPVRTSRDSFYARVSSLSQTDRERGVVAINISFLVWLPRESNRLEALKCLCTTRRSSVLRYA